MLDAIETHEPALNAFVWIDRETALEKAAESEARWARGGALGGTRRPAHDGQGQCRTGGLFDAARLAHLCGNPHGLLRTGGGAHGRGRGDSRRAPRHCRNSAGRESAIHRATASRAIPWDTRFTTGGSSAGAGAAAALNFGVLHIGTDGAGSVRIPSSFCGIFGLKPSYGRIPAYPPSPFAIVSHLGPMTRSVRDAALMLSMTSGPDPRDITALHHASPDFRIGLEDGVRGLRIGWSARLGYVENLDPEVEEITTAAAKVFEEMGAHVEEADPDFEEPIGVIETAVAMPAPGPWSGPSRNHAGTSSIRGCWPSPLKGREVSGPDFVMAASARNMVFSRDGRLP